MSDKQVLAKLLETKGFFLHRHGGSHDIYCNKKGVRLPVPRHNIKKHTIDYIARQLDKIDKIEKIEEGKDK